MALAAAQWWWKTLRWLADRARLVLTGILLCLVLCLPVRADTWRWTGQGVSGSAEVKKFGSVSMAAVDQIAHGLGYKTEVQKEELLVVARTGLRFVRGAAVVWLGYSVIPLPARAHLDSGHWWVSADSVPGIFSNFLKKNGRNITIQWAGAAPPKVSPPAPAKSPSQKPEAKKTPPPETPPPAANLPRVAGLRWGGTQEAVRAVFDLENGLKPQYSLAGESLTVTVDRLSPAVLSKMKSDRADIDLKVQNGAPAKIQFSFPGRTASVFTLSDP